MLGVQRTRPNADGASVPGKRQTWLWKDRKEGRDGESEGIAEGGGRVKGGARRAEEEFAGVASSLEVF